MSLTTQLTETTNTKTKKSLSRRQERLRHWMRSVAFVVLFGALALSGAIVTVCALGRCEYHWHGFAVELRLLPARTGQTRLVLTPLGEVRAHTHRTPVALVASLQEIQVEEIRKLVTNTPRPEALAEDFEKTARADLRNFVERQALFAAFGALIAPLLLSCRRFRFYVVASLIGLGATGFVVTHAIMTFNGKAFDSPTYTGTLKQAPWVIQFGKDAFTKIEALSSKLRTVAGNLNVLYGRIAVAPDRLQAGDDPNTFRVLHVSDLHNNLAALDFLQEVAEQFKVAFIVDTGDLTDFGSPPETVMVQRIGKLPYPYLFVLGNHDSHTVAEALAKTSNVTLLNSQVVTMQGLTLLGLPNPASARAGVGSVDTTPQELAAGGESLLKTVQSLPAPPDIVAIHDPEESRALWGVVPLVLCGHEHRYYLQTQSAPAGISPAAPFQTVLCNAGTTGAAGLRYFEKEKGVPFSCAVLTFQRPPVVKPKPAPDATTPAPVPTANLPEAARPSPAPGAATGTTISAAPPPRPKLLAVDFIVLDGSLGEYSISHHTLGATP